MIAAITVKSHPGQIPYSSNLMLAKFHNGQISPGGRRHESRAWTGRWWPRGASRARARSPLAPPGAPYWSTLILVKWHDGQISFWSNITWRTSARKSSMERRGMCWPRGASRVITAVIVKSHSGQISYSSNLMPVKYHNSQISPGGRRRGSRAWRGRCWPAHTRRFSYSSNAIIVKSEMAILVKSETPGGRRRGSRAWRGRWWPRAASRAISGRFPPPARPPPPPCCIIERQQVTSPSPYTPPYSALYRGLRVWGGGGGP